MSIYDFKVLDSQNNEVSMDAYKGKVLLIVNTATGCGFTPQYKGLEELYNKYKAQGFEILDFPCNQFANQAPGTAAEISQFCTLKYGVSFKQFKKVDVNGDKAEPLFTYLKSQKKGLFSSKIKWNFTKFLVDRNGKVINRFGPPVTPEKISEKISNLL